MLGRTDSRARALLVLLAFALVAGSLGLRLAYWQVARRDELSAMAVQQSSMRYEIPSSRGSIYDRTGTVVLATSVSRDRLAAYPKLLRPKRRQAVADRLVAILGLTGDAAAELTTRMLSEREYVVLARDLDPAVSEQIRTESTGDNPALSALLLEPEPVRMYPQPGGGPGTTLAAHVLGFVNRDGQGQYGIEQFYQDQLAGMPRVVAAQKDAAGNPVPDSSTVLDAGYPGQDLTLTLDASLQVAVEQELLAAWIADRAKRVSAVVMDPYSGEVVAYASYPSYDANDFQAIAAATPERFIDPIVSTVYEPGSVFKMLTATAAIGRGTVTPRTRLTDTGKLWVDGGRAHVDDADHLAMGRMAFRDAIAYSRNVVAAKVALQLGPEHPRVVADPVRDLAPDGLRCGDRDRRRQRGAGHRPRPGRDAVARDRPRERRVRPGDRGDADPAGAGVLGDGQRRDAGPAAGRAVRGRLGDPRRSTAAG